MPPRAAKRTFDTTEQVDEAQLLPRISADIDADEYNPDMEAAFEQLREDFRSQNSEGTLWVHRVPLDDNADVISNGKYVFLFSAPIQRYSTEEIYSRIQREFMPDAMRVTCIRVSATKKGERGMRFNHLVMVERAAARDEKPEQAGLQLGSVGEIVRAIQEGQQATLTILQRAIQQSAPPAAQPSGMQPQIDTLRSLAEIMYLMTGGTRQAVPSHAAVQPSILDQLKTLRELRGFVGELSGDTEGGSNNAEGPVAVLKHLSPWAQVFGNLLSANNAQPPRRSIRAPIPAPNNIPVVRPAPGAAVQPTVSPTIITPGIAPLTPVEVSKPMEGHPVLAELRSEFEALTKAAQEGAAPEQISTVLLGMIPENSSQEGMLVTLLSQNNWFEALCAVYPPASAHQEWFGKLRAAILAEFDSDAAQEAGE